MSRKRPEIRKDFLNGKTHSYEELKEIIHNILYPQRHRKLVSECKYHCKPILIYRNGLFIGEASSTTEASYMTGVQTGHISQYLRGIVKTAKGFIFKYKYSDNDPSVSEK